MSRDLPTFVDAALVASQYQLDDRYAQTLVALANEPRSRDIMPLALPTS